MEWESGSWEWVGYCLGREWGGREGLVMMELASRHAGVNRLWFPFFLSFGFRAFHLFFFSIFSFVHRLVYFIFHSFCFFFFPKCLLLINRWSIYQVGRRTVWMPTANYHSLFYSTAFSCISKRERRAPGSPFCFCGFGYILFREGVFFFFARGAHGFLRYIRCKPVLFYLILFFFAFTSGSFVFYRCHWES